MAGRSATEQNYFWLSALSQVSRGEAALNDATNTDLIERLSAANGDILVGVRSITAATTAAKGHDFQIQ